MQKLPNLSLHGWTEATLFKHTSMNSKDMFMNEHSYSVTMNANISSRARQLSQAKVTGAALDREAVLEDFRDPTNGLVPQGPFFYDQP